MRESISNAVLLNIIIVFIIVILILLSTSLSYSKAFKVKNRIVNLIEKYEGFESGGISQQEIDKELAKIGYRINPNAMNDCHIKQVGGAYTSKVMNPVSDYSYCVVKYGTPKGPYYSVTTYIYFDIPFIGTLKFPLTGETRIIYDDIEN